ncbi:MAG: hypothetical protein HYY62_03950 [Deltaproteobacteria bacterium]|nr:hypothetical protein [Deltaproteobacteria bacterium]
MRRFLIAGMGVLMGGVLPFFAYAQLFKSSDVAGLMTVEDESKAVVILVDNMLREVRGFPAQLTQLSPSCYPFRHEIGSHTYYFQSESILNRFKACKDLQKTACEHTQREREGNSQKQEELKGEISGIFDAHKRDIFEEKVREKLDELSSQNPLLKQTAEESMNAHVEYLNQHGREGLRTFFKSHYVQPNIGFIHLRPNDGLSYKGPMMLTLERFIEKFQTRDPNLFEKLKRFLHKAVNGIGERSENLLKLYDALFTSLSDEEIRAFTQEFTVSLYEEFSNSLSRELNWLQAPSEVTAQAEARFYPSHKKGEITQAFNDVKQKISALMQNKSTETGIDTSQALSVLNTLELSWPMDLAREEGFIGDTLKAMISTENAAYMPDINRIMIHVPFLNIPRWQIIWLLGHEIGHAVGLKREYVPQFWKHLKDCFDEQGFKEYQMGEVFSDWLATEILTQLLESQTPPLREEEKREALLEAVLFCTPGEENEGALDLFGQPEPHPANWKRINKIIRSHPYVNKLFGCSSSPPYCSGDQPGGRQ